MAEIFRLIDEESTVVVWKIEETIEFFLTRLPYELKDLPAQNESRNLQWLAARYLLYIITDQGLITKDEFQKPFLLNDNRYISISHSYDVAAVILSRRSCGIDIEKDLPRIQRIASKYMSSVDIERISGSQYQEHLYKVWCSKEAMYKAYGLGLLDFKQNLFLDISAIQSNVNHFTGSLRKNEDVLDFQLRYHKLQSSYHLVYGIKN